MTEDLIKRLRQALADHYSPNAIWDVATEAASELERLSAELAEARKDAERWRWIRDEAVWRGEPDGEGNMVWCVIGPNAYNLTPIDGADLDEEVDNRLAALASEQPQPSAPFEGCWVSNSGVNGVVIAQPQEDK